MALATTVTSKRTITNIWTDIDGLLVATNPTMTLTSVLTEGWKRMTLVLYDQPLVSECMDFGIIER